MRFKRSVFWASVAILVLSACTQSPQAKEAKYLEKGRKEFEKKNYAAAILHFKNAVPAQPRDAEPYYQLGLSYLAANDSNTACLLFSESHRVEPQAHRRAVEAGGVDVRRQQGGDRGGAEARAGSADTLPEDIDALDVLAVTELRLGKPESAESHLEQALKKSPDS